MNFNPFKKGNEAKEQKRAADWIAQKEKVETLMSAADAIKDPAEKVVALRRISVILGMMLADEKTGIARETVKKGLNATMATELPLAGGGLAAALLLTGPLGWAGVGAVWGGIIAAPIVKLQREKYVRRKLESAAAGHLEYLSGKKTEIEAGTEQLVAEHVSEISKSPLHGEIMQDAGLAKVFADAAAKHVVAQEQEVAALKEAQKKAKEEAAPHFKKDYKKLADVMKPPAEKKRSAKKSGPKQN